jgi:hypothetical protein
MDGSILANPNEITSAVPYHTYETLWGFGAAAIIIVVGFAGFQMTAAPTRWLRSIQSYKLKEWEDDEEEEETTQEIELEAAAAEDASELTAVGAAPATRKKFFEAEDGSRIPLKTSKQS